MADIEFVRKYKQDIDAAKADVRKLVEGTQQRHPSLIKDIEWAGDGMSAKASGTGFNARFKLDKGNVSVTVKLSFFAKPFKGKVRDLMRKDIDQYFPE